MSKTWSKNPNTIITKYLATLHELPRPTKGFAIKAELRMSSGDGGRGVGVFAAEFIPAGTRVDTDYEGHRSFNEKEAYAFIESLPNDEERRWWLEHVYCFDGTVKMNFGEPDTMMINHSDNPTIVTRPNGYDYTTRDVHAREELTEDYRTYDVLPYFEELCAKYGAEDFNPKWNTSSTTCTPNGES